MDFHRHFEDFPVDRICNSMVTYAGSRDSGSGNAVPKWESCLPIGASLDPPSIARKSVILIDLKSFRIILLQAIFDRIS